MRLWVEIAFGPDTGKVIAFPSNAERITIGRDVACDVRFPEDLTIIGRHHCGLQLDRGAGVYKFVLNTRHPVFVDGREAYDGMELQNSCTLRLATRSGPSIEIELRDDTGLKTTDPVTPTPPVAEKVRWAYRFTAVLAVVVVGVAGVLAVANMATNRRIDDVWRIAQSTEDSAAIGRLVDRVRNSVYLVAAVDNKDGEATNIGTAWVVLLKDGSKAFATNGHIADMVKEVDRSKHVVVRSPASGHLDHKIARADVHPGYDAFNKFLDDRKAEIAQGIFRQFGVPGGYDVAVLIPEKQQGIAEPLVIARDSDLKSLHVGQFLFFLGYPSEGVYASEIGAPSPTFQRGAVTNITTFFLRPDVASGHLIQHSLPAIGGASGSPILNAKGEVVALLNSGNVAYTETGARIPSAALINFGHRADLLRELIEGTADGRLPSYRASWSGALAYLARPPETVAMETIAEFKRENCNPTSVFEKLVRLDTPYRELGGRLGAAQPLAATARGLYLALAYTNQPGALSLHLFDDRWDKPVQEQKPGARMTYMHTAFGEDRAVRLAVALAEKDEVAAKATAPVEAKLIVWRADAKPAAPKSGPIQCPAAPAQAMAEPARAEGP